MEKGGHNFFPGEGAKVSFKEGWVKIFFRKGLVKIFFWVGEDFFHVRGVKIFFGEGGSRKGVKTFCSERLVSDDFVRAIFHPTYTISCLTSASTVSCLSSKLPIA